MIFSDALCCNSNLPSSLNKNTLKALCSKPVIGCSGHGMLINGAYVGFKWYLSGVFIGFKWGLCRVYVGFK